MHTAKPVIDQIKCDIHNIQELVNLLSECKWKEKTRYNAIQNAIKTLVKEIRRQKQLVSNKVYYKEFKHVPVLFEVLPSEIEQEDISEITSFFGLLD